LLFQHDGPIVFSIDSDGQLKKIPPVRTLKHVGLPLEILRACKQMNTEAEQAFYRTNAFVLLLPSLSLITLLPRGFEHLTAIEIDCSCPNDEGLGLVGGYVTLIAQLTKMAPGLQQITLNLQFSCKLLAAALEVSNAFPLCSSTFSSTPSLHLTVVPLHNVEEDSPASIFVRLRKGPPKGKIEGEIYSEMMRPESKLSFISSYFSSTGRTWLSEKEAPNLRNIELKGTVEPEFVRKIEAHRCSADGCLWERQGDEAEVEPSSLVDDDSTTDDRAVADLTTYHPEPIRFVWSHDQKADDDATKAKVELDMRQWCPPPPRAYRKALREMGAGPYIDADPAVRPPHVLPDTGAANVQDTDFASDEATSDDGSNASYHGEPPSNPGDGDGENSNPVEGTGEAIIKAWLNSLNPTPFPGYPRINQPAPIPVDQLEAACMHEIYPQEFPPPRPYPWITEATRSGAQPTALSDSAPMIPWLGQTAIPSSADVGPGPSAVAAEPEPWYADAGPESSVAAAGISVPVDNIYSSEDSDNPKAQSRHKRTVDEISRFIKYGDPWITDEFLAKARANKNTVGRAEDSQKSDGKASGSHPDGGDDTKDDFFGDWNDIYKRRGQRP
jgi:hypothetical protein